MFVQLEIAHSKSQLLEALIRGLLDIILCKSPHSGLRAANDPLETTRASFPLLPLDCNIAKAEIAINPQLLGLCLLGRNFGLDLVFSLESIVVCPKTGEARGLSSGSGRFRLNGGAACSCSGRRRFLWRRLWRRNLLRHGGYGIEQFLVRLLVLLSAELELAHRRAIFLGRHAVSWSKAKLAEIDGRRGDTDIQCDSDKCCARSKCLRQWKLEWAKIHGGDVRGTSQSATR